MSIVIKAGQAVRIAGVVKTSADGTLTLTESEESDLVGAIDVDNFPTLLIARGTEVLFFGTVTPHASTLARLKQAALEGQSHLGGEAPDAEVRALAARL